MEHNESPESYPVGFVGEIPTIAFFVPKRWREGRLDTYGKSIGPMAYYITYVFDFGLVFNRFHFVAGGITHDAILAILFSEQLYEVFPVATVIAGQFTGIDV